MRDLDRVQQPSKYGRRAPTPRYFAILLFRGIGGYRPTDEARGNRDGRMGPIGVILDAPAQ